MSEANIPFKSYFREPLLNGKKTKTARSKRMGEPGDTFTAFGQQFRLLRVDDVDLYTVSTFWRDEGCTSREHFIEIWNWIHPIKKYSDTQRVYLHWFERI